MNEAARFLLAVLLADLIGTCGLLAVQAANGPAPTVDAVVFFGGLSVIFAAPPLAIGMGLAMLCLLWVNHPPWLESGFMAVLLGGTSGYLAWATSTGHQLSEVGFGYGASAGLSLWLFFKKTLCRRRLSGDAKSLPFEQKPHA